MEKISVKDIVWSNKRYTEVFGIFMSERLVVPDGRPGKLLRQFLAEERLEGRVPLLGGGPLYRPLEERSIVITPREWGVETPDELVGACVGVTVIGTIPIAEDDPSAGEVLIVRLTEPDGTVPADFVRCGDGGCFDTDVYLGWDCWVDYPPGIPTAFPAEPEPESDPTPDTIDDNDDEGYW